MQTQDALEDITFKLLPWAKANQTRLIAAAVAVVVLIGVYFFISGQHDENEAAAGLALTRLMISPPPGASLSQSGDLLVQLAAKYSGTAAAQRAQLQGAAAMFAASRYPDAQVQFQKFLSMNSSGPMAATAQLGVGASLEAQGKLDEAATAYQKVATGFSGTPGAVSANFALGRICETQGKTAEAINHYESVAHLGQAGGSLAQMANLSAVELRAKSPVTPKTSAIPVSIPAK